MSGYFIGIGNVLFNDALNTFYLRLYGVGHMVKDDSDSERRNHMGYSFRLAARGILYAPSHRQDNTYHGLCYTSRGALAETRNRDTFYKKKEKEKDYINYSLSIITYSINFSFVWGFFHRELKLCVKSFCYEGVHAIMSNANLTRISTIALPVTDLPIGNVFFWKHVITD